jgi:ribosomal protein S18 acetylase RimI-like enzyme
MIVNPEHPLDNPAWYALNSHHREFAVGNEIVKRYRPEIAPFVSCKPGHEVEFDQLNEWLSDGEIFYFIGDASSFPGSWKVEKELDCVQMTCEQLIPIEEYPDEIHLLTSAESKVLYDLIQLVQPGYYVEQTRLLGRYFGIYSGQQLVAVAGERLRFEDYTEVSGICTHPDFTGRQFGHQLTTHVTNLNLSTANKVFLHALRSNTRAIRLYEHLGFTLRRNIPIWKLKYIR